MPLRCFVICLFFWGVVFKFNASRQIAILGSVSGSRCRETEVRLRRVLIPRPQTLNFKPYRTKDFLFFIAPAQSNVISSSHATHFQIHSKTTFPDSQCEKQFAVNPSPVITQRLPLRLTVLKVCFAWDMGFRAYLSTSLRPRFVRGHRDVCPQCQASCVCEVPSPISLEHKPFRP